jgi:hypothetical protein
VGGPKFEGEEVVNVVKSLRSCRCVCVLLEKLNVLSRGVRSLNKGMIRGQKNAGMGAGTNFGLGWLR